MSKFVRLTLAAALYKLYRILKHDSASSPGHAVVERTAPRTELGEGECTKM